MKRSKKRSVLIAISMIASTIWLAGIHATFAENSPKGEAAQRAHIDPDTGKFIEQPNTTPAVDRASEKAAFNTSDEGLVETPSPVEGGGTLVDLQGRFRSPLTATVEKDGNVRITHKPIEKP